MLADGSIVECSKEQRPELFEAQRLSLGLLGVATRIRVDVMPAYHLEERIERVPLAAAIEQFEDVARTHRHAEFFVFPYADEVIMKTLHPAAEAGDVQGAVVERRNDLQILLRRDRRGARPSRACCSGS